MDSRKYIGMDVHQASIAIAVRDTTGKLLMECIIETKAGRVLEFIRGLHGSLWITFEEGTMAAWLSGLLKPHVARVIVCDPRKNALLKAGNKNDRVDARNIVAALQTITDSAPANAFSSANGLCLDILVRLAVSALWWWNGSDREAYRSTDPLEICWP